MEHKSFPSKVIEMPNERTVMGLSAIMGTIDFGNDRIFKGSFLKTIQENMDRVRHLWQHDMTMPPIAAIKELREVGRTDLPQDLKDKHPEAKGGLLVVREYLDTPRGNEVLAGIKSGALNQMSFGFDAVKFDFEEVKEGDNGPVLIRNLRELRLYDTSDVLWGMNENTVASIKSVISFADFGISDEVTEWKTPVISDFGKNENFDEIDEAELKRISSHYGWVGNVNSPSFSDLKFPHHLPSNGGVGKAVFAGVELAMKNLMQADPGIPMSDRKAVYDHLAGHYQQFGKTAPEWDVIKLMWAISDGIKTLTAKEEIHSKLVTLDLILRAEPKQIPDPVLLTQENLIRQLELRKRQLALV